LWDRINEDLIADSSIDSLMTGYRTHLCNFPILNSSIQSSMMQSQNLQCY
jgi:hypothetical protein